jgi:hypothetical protein
MDNIMYALLQLKNLTEEHGLDGKLKNYEYLGVYESLKEVENSYKNYYPHKYRLKDYGWCYFVKRSTDFNRDTDSHLLADKVIIDMNFELDEFYDYQSDKTYSKVSDEIIKKILRDIKLNMIL